MAKKNIKKLVKVQIPAGKATPAPPVGPALGAAGVQIQEFCVKFNDATRDKGDVILPCVITVYDDRTFDFIVKTEPAAVQIKKVLKLKSGSAKPHLDKVGSITKKQLEEIAQNKMEDLNAIDLDAAVKIVAGTARSMGVKVTD